MIKTKLLFLMALLVSSTMTWAQTAPAGLSIDRDYSSNQEGYYYVNMSSNSTVSVIQFANTDFAFKVYDDGGKNDKARTNSVGYLKLQAPEGYGFEVEGTIVGLNNDVFRIYNSSKIDNTKLLYDFDSSSHSGMTSNEPISVRRTTDSWMYIYFFSPNGDVDGFELTVRFKPLTGCNGQGTEDSPYEIGSGEAWNRLCTNVAGGDTYAGMYFKQMADFAIGQGIGTDDYAFCGHYDGNGKTLTANITSYGTAAPFYKVDGVTIKDLIVTGSVETTQNSGADHTAGLIAKAAGTVSINNVRVSSTVTGFTYYGGFIGHGGSSTISMAGCVFDGILTENTDGSTQHAGGFIGWSDNMTVTMTDCIFAGTTLINNTTGSGKKNFHPVGYYCKANDVSVTPELTNVYYTEAPSAQTEVNNGVALSNGEKQVYSITTSDPNVTELYFSGSVSAEYTVSGLKLYYVFGLDTGIALGSTLYAGGSDKVSLTLAHAEPQARMEFTGYEVSGGGSLNYSGTTTENTPKLIMTAANQTISTTYDYISWTKNGNYATEFSTTEAGGQTIIINSEAELARLAYLVNNYTYNSNSANNDLDITNNDEGNYYDGYYYKLGKDLDMSDYAWPTMGNADHRFLAIFDGDGHTISGLHSLLKGQQSALIGTNNGAVGNLIIANSKFTGSKYAAAIVCDNRNEVQNCRVEDDVIVTCTGQGEYTYSGGVVAYQQNQDNIYAVSEGMTQGCYSAAHVTGNDRVGGLVGRLVNGTVEHNVSNAVVGYTVETSRIAYIIGDQAGGTAQFNYYITGSESSNTNDVRAYPVTLSNALQDFGFTIVQSTNKNFDASKLYFSQGQYGSTYYVGQFKLDDKWYAPNTINVSNSQSSNYYVKFYFNLSKEVEGIQVASVEDVKVNGVAPGTESGKYCFEVNGETVISGDALITLYDDGDMNDFYLTHNNGCTANVKLQGRTLYKDGHWNTICLPFDLTIYGSVLWANGYKVRTLDRQNYYADNGNLWLNLFSDLSEIKAGVPYIIKWPDTNATIENPIFEGVTVKYDAADQPEAQAVGDATTPVIFVGNYNKMPQPAENRSLLYLGADDKLYYPDGSNSDFTINAFRAVFMLRDGLVAGEPEQGNPAQGVRCFIDFDEGSETTRIISIGQLDNLQSDNWYDLSGRKIVNSKLLNGKLPKGIYIHNGKKYIIK